MEKIDDLKVRNDLNVFSIRKFLDHDECKKICKMMDDAFLDPETGAEKGTCKCKKCVKKNLKRLYVQTICKNREIYKFLKNIVKDRLLDKYDLTYKNRYPVKLMKDMTFSIHSKGHNINFHVDKRIAGHNNILKFFIYLNSVEGGGSIFVPLDKTERDTNSHLNIVPHTGDLVIFDIDTMHSGAPIHKGNKYVLGFRFEFDT